MNNSDFFTRFQAEKKHLAQIIEQFEGAEVMVIGDIALDEFVTGEAERISREAPVVIVRHEKTVQVPGGAGNTLYNLADLGAKTYGVGRIGNDFYGDALLKCLKNKQIDTTGISILADYTTTAKTRIAAHSRQSVTQQIVRIDRKQEKSFERTDEASLCEKIATHIPKLKAIICSDYGENILSTNVIATALSHHLVIVDAQKDLAKYKGATIFTPNLPEAEQAVGYFITDEQKLLQAGKDLFRLTEAKYILITRGENGMTLFEKNAENEPISSHIPAFNHSKVFDVTGAGDTVTAVLGLALSVGATAWQAAVLGNLAASIVVQYFGTVTVKKKDLLQALHDSIC